MTMLRVFDAQILADYVVGGIWADPTLPKEPREEPEEKVVDWLGRARLLHGVPFEYLIPDEGLLEPGTIRFFHLDRNWTDALVDGAISAGTVTNRDRREVQVDHVELRSKVDDAERAQWVDPPTTSTKPAPVSGFLLRSRAVSGWPGLHVRALRKVRGSFRELRVLRIERLAPAILIAMFDGIPDRVEIEEPRTGIQFGTRSDRFSDEPANTWWIDVRNRNTGVEIEDSTRVSGIANVQVPFRKGSAGVIHLTELTKRLLADERAELDDSLDSAELALQLLRYPYQQAFEGNGSDADPSDLHGALLPGRALTSTELRVPWLTVRDGVTSRERADALLEMMRAFNE